MGHRQQKMAHGVTALRIHNHRPEALWLEDPGSGWHRVPLEQVKEWPEEGWLRAGAVPEDAPAFPESELRRVGNATFWNFASGERPDGSLSPLGMTFRSRDFKCGLAAKHQITAGYS